MSGTQIVTCVCVCVCIHTMYIIYNSYFCLSKSSDCSQVEDWEGCGDDSSSLLLSEKNDATCQYLFFQQLNYLQKP